MNLLDRYLFKSVLATCLGAVGLFAFVLIVGNVMKEVMGYLLAGQIDFLTFASLLVLLLPFVTTFALPMGMLTGVLLTLGRVSADSEITAMRSSGISLARLARPILLLGLLGFALAFWINHAVMPAARIGYKKELAEAVRANPLKVIVPRTFIRQFPGLVIYVGEKEDARLSDLWLWQLDKEHRVIRVVRAAEGAITYDEADNALVLTLRRAQIEFRDEKQPELFKATKVIGSFEETEALRLSLDRMFAKAPTRTKLDYLPYAELRQQRARLESILPEETPEQRRQKEREQVRIDLVLSERFNHALAVFSLTLVGIPLGIRVSRRETSANLGLALLIALAYYFLVSAIGWLDKSPALRPDLLLFIPNLLALTIGLILFRRVGRA